MCMGVYTALYTIYHFLFGSEPFSWAPPLLMASFIFPFACCQLENYKLAALAGLVTCWSIIINLVVFIIIRIGD